jgi:hypothetical protein
VARSVAGTADLVEELLAVAAVAGSLLLVQIFRGDDVSMPNGLSHFTRNNHRVYCAGLSDNLCDRLDLDLTQHRYHLARRSTAGGRSLERDNEKSRPKTQNYQLARQQHPLISAN